ncbi:MAG: hypothetical protein ACFHW5_02105 [Verrucomicrobiota bacterium]
MEASNDPSRPGVFKTTSWSIVRDAGQQASIALQQLCEVYWPPLYGFALRSGYDEHQAKDLTQGFFGSSTKTVELSIWNYREMMAP